MHHLGRPRHAQCKHRRDNAKRQVDGEHRAPAEMLGQVGAHDRAGRAGQREQHGEVARETAALTRRHVLADHRLRERHQPTAAQALQRARRDQCKQGRRQRAGQRRHREDRQREEQHPLPAEAVAQVSVQWRGDRGCQQVSDDDP